MFTMYDNALYNHPFLHSRQFVRSMKRPPRETWKERQMVLVQELH